MVAVLATNPSALNAFTELNDELLSGSLPTGSAYLSRVNSALDKLPTEVAGPYRDFFSAEVSLYSSVVNSGSGSSPTGGSGSNGSGSSNAAPQATGAIVKVAGAAAGAFVAAIALL